MVTGFGYIHVYEVVTFGIVAIEECWLLQPSKAETTSAQQAQTCKWKRGQDPGMQSKAAYNRKQD